MAAQVCDGVYMLSHEWYGWKINQRGALVGPGVKLKFKPWQLSILADNVSPERLAGTTKTRNTLAVLHYLHEGIATGIGGAAANDDDPHVLAACGQQTEFAGF